MFTEDDLDVPSWIGFAKNKPKPPEETFWLITSDNEYVFDFDVNQVEVAHEEGG